MIIADKKTLTRRIVDYLHKYATHEQVFKIAKKLNINTEAKTL